MLNLPLGPERVPERVQNSPFGPERDQKRTNSMLILLRSLLREMHVGATTRAFP